MINSNPETVSTDFDTSDMLFFEPLTHEDVMNVIDRITPHGVIVQFGGQTPLNLARGLHDHGAPLIGTSVSSIEEAEDRDLFSKLITKIDIDQPPNGMAATAEEALAVANRIGYPVLVRPSFVLGGRAMEVIYENAGLQAYMERHRSFSEDQPLLVDKFLDAAIEVDVDAIADGENVAIGGIASIRSPTRSTKTRTRSTGACATTRPPTSIPSTASGRCRATTTSAPRSTTPRPSPPRAASRWSDGPRQSSRCSSRPILPATPACAVS
jgi:carbamoyl-phosphate synthase large subunit